MFQRAFSFLRYRNCDKTLWNCLGHCSRGLPSAEVRGLVRSTYFPRVAVRQPRDRLTIGAMGFQDSPDLSRKRWSESHETFWIYPVHFSDGWTSAKVRGWLCSTPSSREELHRQADPPNHQTIRAMCFRGLPSLFLKRRSAASAVTHLRRRHFLEMFRAAEKLPWR